MVQSIECRNCSNVTQIAPQSLISLGRRSLCNDLCRQVVESRNPSSEFKHMNWKISEFGFQKRKLTPKGFLIISFLSEMHPLNAMHSDPY